MGAPHAYCDEDTPDFLGVRELDLRSVVIGDELCYQDSQGRPVLMWTFTPILLMGQAVGTDVNEFLDWWIGYYGHETPTTAIVRAVNAAADPPFPTPEETALLAHVPEASKVNCMRPPRYQIEQNLTSEPVAAVVCGPTPGASIVFYYQVENLATLRAEFAFNTGVDGPDCTSRPEGFRGSGTYSIGDRSGQLACAENRNGDPYLIWTDERRTIIVFAFFGYNHDVLLEWWESGAGPL